MNNFLPGLYIVSTPIGNLQDITLRAINVLKNSDKILCEDTRRSLKLLNYYNIKKKLVAYHKFNEKKLTPSIVEFIQNGEKISLISDAGTPIMSDPGLVLLRECIKKKIKIFPIPGASAISTAMSISNFDEKYLFYGFLPKKQKELERIFKNLNNIEHSLVFFISAQKINFYIDQFKKYFLDRKILIAREMTKIHEEFIRSNVKLIKKLPENIKGELTIVLSEKIKEKKNKEEISESVKIEIKKMIKKYSHKDVVEFVSKKENLKKKLIYEYCLKLKK